MSAISALSDTTKHSADEGETDDDPSNRTNPALVRQSKKTKSEIWPPAHCISAFQTVRLTIDPWRYITDLSSKISSTGETTLELDSHADTCVLGRDALIFLNYDRPVIVKGYDPSLGTKTYATVSGAIAYDDPLTGEVYHIHFEFKTLWSPTVVCLVSTAVPQVGNSCKKIFYFFIAAD